MDSDADALKLCRVQKITCWQTTVNEESHGWSRGHFSGLKEAALLLKISHGLQARSVLGSALLLCKSLQVMGGPRYDTPEHSWSHSDFSCSAVSLVQSPFLSAHKNREAYPEALTGAVRIMTGACRTSFCVQHWYKQYCNVECCSGINTGNGYWWTGTSWEKKFMWAISIHGDTWKEARGNVLVK